MMLNLKRKQVLVTFTINEKLNQAYLSTKTIKELRESYKAFKEWNNIIRYCIPSIGLFELKGNEEYNKDIEQILSYWI